MLSTGIVKPNVEPIKPNKSIFKPNKSILKPGMGFYGLNRCLVLITVFINIKNNEHIFYVASHNKRIQAEEWCYSSCVKLIQHVQNIQYIYIK